MMPFLGAALAGFALGYLIGAARDDDAFMEGVQYGRRSAVEDMQDRDTWGRA